MQVVYARWPKSAWYLQIATEDDDRGTRHTVGVYAMHVLNENLRKWLWADLKSDVAWVLSEIPEAAAEECDELLGLLAQIRYEHEHQTVLEVKSVVVDDKPVRVPRAKRTAMVVTNTTVADELDLPVF